MALAVTNTRTATSIAGAASTTLAYLSAVTVGSTLFTGGAWFNGSGVVTGPVISDTVNGTWTSKNYATIVGLAAVETVLAAFPNTASGTPTITLNPNGASADIGIFAIGEVTGAATSSVDVIAAASVQASTNTPFIASGTLAQANEVLFAIMSSDYPNNGVSPFTGSITGDGTYTQLVKQTDNGTSQAGQMQYKIVATTASDQADWVTAPDSVGATGDTVSSLMSIKAAAVTTDAQDWMTKPASMRMRFERSILY